MYRIRSANPIKVANASERLKFNRYESPNWKRLVYVMYPCQADALKAVPAPLVWLWMARVRKICLLWKTFHLDSKRTSSSRLFMRVMQLVLSCCNPDELQETASNHQPALAFEESRHSRQDPKTTGRPLERYASESEVEWKLEIWNGNEIEWKNGMALAFLVCWKSLENHLPRKRNQLKYVDDICLSKTLNTLRIHSKES